MSTREQRGSYKDDVRRLRVLDEWCGEKLVEQVDRELVSKIRTGLKVRGLKAATVNRYLTLLIAILNHSADQGWISQPPRIKKEKEGPGRLEYLTPEEVRSLIDHLEYQHHKDFVTLAVSTGLRKTNLLHLEWSQVDLFRGAITIHADQAKNRKPLVIPINQMAKNVLKRLNRPAGRVLTYKGKGLNDIARRSLKKAQRDAGITKNVHPHIFRHTFASWHIMNGTSLYELKELGGWSKIDSVLIYAHLNIDHLKTIENREQIQRAFTL